MEYLFHRISFFIAAVTAKLVGGKSPNEGRIQIKHYKYGKGTVCDNNWGIKDASVICKMIGYGAAKDAPGRSYFGQGTGRVLLNDVGCDSSETNIEECEHSGWIQRTCRYHRKDASAICYQSK